MEGKPSTIIQVVPFYLSTVDILGVDILRIDRTALPGLYPAVLGKGPCSPKLGKNDHLTSKLGKINDKT